MRGKNALIILILALGIILRFYHLEFGLPKSFRADESEIVEPAIYYTYQIKDVIKNNNYYKLIPTSYVYGTVPTYFFTLEIMTLSKLHSVLGWDFSKFDMYLGVRAIFALMSTAIVIYTALLYKKLFSSTLGFIWMLLFGCLNWKLIVHGHYANPDLVITFLFLLSVLTFYQYFKSENATKHIWLSSLLFGLAVGTKITVLISLPLFLYVFIAKKDIKNMMGFLLLTILTFMLTNPFSLIFRYDFLLRVLEMAFKESSVVLDSADSNPLKYLVSLGYIVTPILTLLSAIGIYMSFKLKENIIFHIFLSGNILIYLVFFSLGDRNVDRWLLPILPLTLIYATFGFTKIKQVLSKKAGWVFAFLVLLSIAYFPTLLLTQFTREVPKSEAYYWVKDTLPPLSKVYVITEEGLDPLDEIKGVEVSQLPLYASEGAQYFFPKNPKEYQYIILSSRPMENFKKKEIRDAFPYYAKKMSGFEDIVTSSTDFKLIKSFVRTKPNLIPLSDVFIYENISFTGNL